MDAIVRECSKDDGLWGIRMSAVSVSMSVVHFAKSRDASCRMVQGPVALQARVVVRCEASRGESVRVRWQHLVGNLSFNAIRSSTI